MTESFEWLPEELVWPPQHPLEPELVDPLWPELVDPLEPELLDPLELSGGELCCF